jgi:N-sulfoglucosamine sulfohydrolase
MHLLQVLPVRPHEQQYLQVRTYGESEKREFYTVSIPADLPLFTHILSDNGYHVGYTGKGYAPGDPYYLGLERHPLIKSYNEQKESRIARNISENDYSANFNDFLDDRDKKQPFFFWFGGWEPHRDYQYRIGEDEADLDPELVEIPDFWPDHPIVRSDILDYYYEIMWFDTHLGGMIEKLEEIGELDNTIIIVTSDNGMPFPRAKVNLYDWGTRIPLAIRWGDKIVPGRVIDDFMLLTDFAPTLLEAAGLSIPEQMTGKSLMNIFTSHLGGILEIERDHVITALERHTYTRPDGETYPMRAIRTHDFLYIRNFKPERWPAGNPDFISSNKTFFGDVDAAPTKSFMVQYREKYPFQYELSFGKRPFEELYQVHKDKYQVNNIAENPLYKSVKDSLASKLISTLEATGDPRVSGEDPWQHYIYHQYDGFGSVFNSILSKSERDRAALRPSHQPAFIID